MPVTKINSVTSVFCDCRPNMRKKHSVASIRMTEKDIDVLAFVHWCFCALMFVPARSMQPTFYGLQDNDILGLASGLLPSYSCSWGSKSRVTRCSGAFLGKGLLSPPSLPNVSVRQPSMLNSFATTAHRAGCFWQTQPVCCNLQATW